MHDAASSSTLANDGDLVRIAIEQMNVFLHPLECKPLVVKPSIGDSIILDFVAAQEAERAQTVVHGNIDEAAGRWSILTSLEQARRRSAPRLGSARIATAIDPNKNRCLLVLVLPGPLVDVFGNENI